MPRTGDIARLDLGTFVRPAAETGIGRARIEALLCYALSLAPGHVLLFDTGMAHHPAIDARYRPRRRPLARALADVGLTADDVALVVNCHLHVDHCGGNPTFSGIPIVVQVRELDDARSTERYTLPELVDFPGVRYEPIDGDAELAPGVSVIPTAGHTAGHQSLVLRCDDGTVVLAGQSHDTTTAFAADVSAWRATRDGVDGLPDPPPWVERIARLDPRRVLLAHDQSVWEPASWAGQPFRR